MQCAIIIASLGRFAIVSCSPQIVVAFGLTWDKGCMVKLSKGDTSASETEAWSRFERAVDVVAKSPPQHRTKEKPKASPKKRSAAKRVAK